MLAGWGVQHPRISWHGMEGDGHLLSLLFLVTPSKQKVYPFIAELTQKRPYYRLEIVQSIETFSTVKSISPQEKNL